MENRGGVDKDMQDAETGIVPENIRIHRKADSWEEAIRVAAEPLIVASSIIPTYVTSMIESVQRLGPYIVLMPGFALAHAQPNVQSVRKNDISLAVFDDPIEFHSKKGPVYVVMCLACTDHTSHIKRLQGVAEILLDKERIVDDMRACRDSKELSDLLHG